MSAARARGLKSTLMMSSADQPACPSLLVNLSPPRATGQFPSSVDNSFSKTKRDTEVISEGKGLIKLDTGQNIVLFILFHLFLFLYPGKDRSVKFLTFLTVRIKMFRC